MIQAIQGRTGEPFAAEDFGPVLERQIRSHDQAVPLVRCGDHIEQQLRSSLAGGNVTHDALSGPPTQPNELASLLDVRGGLQHLDREGLKQQREATVRSSPGNVDIADTALGTAAGTLVGVHQSNLDTQRSDIEVHGFDLPVLSEAQQHRIMES